MERLANGDLSQWTKNLSLAVIAFCTLPHKSTGFLSFCLPYSLEALTLSKVGVYCYTPFESYDRAALEHTLMMLELFAAAHQRPQTVAG